jgi:hypothetical protein
MICPLRNAQRITKCTARNKMFDAMGCLARDAMLGARRDVRRSMESSARDKEPDAWRAMGCTVHDWRFAAELWGYPLGQCRWCNLLPD